MAIRLGLVLILLTLAIAAESSSLLHDAHWGLTSRGDGGLPALQTCNGLVGDCIDVDEEMMMQSESARRTLAGRSYISYEALKKNNVPCSRRGNSYYNCAARGRANPYNRGCNAITKCARGGR